MKKVLPGNNGGDKNRFLKIEWFQFWNHKTHALFGLHFVVCSFCFDGDISSLTWKPKRKRTNWYYPLHCICICICICIGLETDFDHQNIKMIKDRWWWFTEMVAPKLSGPTFSFELWPPLPTWSHHMGPTLLT